MVSATEQALPTRRVRETRLVRPAVSLRAYQRRRQVSSPLLALSPRSSTVDVMPWSSYVVATVRARQALAPVRYVYVVVAPVRTYRATWSPAPLTFCRAVSLDQGSSTVALIGVVPS